MERQLREADYVLVVCTETYLRRADGRETPGRRRGVRWESTLFYQHFYDADAYNTRFIPIFWDWKDERHIPVPLRGATYYCVAGDEGYWNLYRHLTGQPKVNQPKLGSVRQLESLDNLGQVGGARSQLKLSSSEPEPSKMSNIVLPRQPFEPEMVLIPAGEFLMGSDPRKDPDARGDEQPQHALYLPEYYIAKTSVTNAQYLAFVRATGHRQPYWKNGNPPQGKEDHPIVYVSWDDANTYCRWLAEVTGKPYRLPSEAEWEKGARGMDGCVYPWGDDPPDKTRCNFGDFDRGITPVGKYSPQGDSPYGCADMAGNVWEWTSSLYVEYPYDPNDGREDMRRVGGVRALRGGAFYSDTNAVRCGHRLWNLPRSSPPSGSFRVCIPAQQD
jgi:formylglycine-generating enzyme required for sulfatase activity